MNLRRFLAGQHIGQHLSGFGAQAQSAGHGFGRGLVVARNHHQLQAAIAQRGQCLCSTRFGLIAKTHEQQGLQICIGALGQGRQTRALRLQGVDVWLPHADVQTFFLQPAQTAQQQLLAVYLGQHAFAGHGLQILSGGA